jgi:hypothetical protein
MRTEALIEVMVARDFPRYDLGTRSHRNENEGRALRAKRCMPNAVYIYLQTIYSNSKQYLLKAPKIPVGVRD